MSTIDRWIHNRFVIFGIFLVEFSLLNWYFLGSIFPSPDPQNLWFYSGIFMVLFSILFIEPYYSSPKNVITNVIPLLIVLLSIGPVFKEHMTIFYIAIFTLLLILTLSIVSIALADKNKSQEHRQNKLSKLFKNIVVYVGQGKFLYSIVFLYFLIMYYSTNTVHFLLLMITWFVIISLDPKRIKNTFAAKKNIYTSDAIGSIFGVQAKNIFLVKLFEDKSKTKKFDIVKFHYSMQDHNDIMIGIIIDTYLLNQEKWAKIIQLKTTHSSNNDLEKNIVYTAPNASQLETEMKANNFVGIVVEGSDIGKIKFEYSTKQDDIQEGDVIELKSHNKRLFYQVVNGVTQKELLEQKNEKGFIKAEAIQLGEWNNKKISFQKYGWVPEISTPIFKADTSDITKSSLDYPDYKMGVIQGTTLPSVINLSQAVSHHMALLGVTGAGKSHFARKIIEKLRKDTKIICIDFTGEWKQKFNTGDIEDYTDIKDTISTNAISIIELKEVSNTTESLEETNKKLNEIFTYAKNNPNCKPICLVLEEAHTIIPETTFLGDFGDFSKNKALVNNMSQIALQGRKYGVGLLVIAQRTANVSKTVLTQCNTIISYQAFDETGFNFLSNYIGKNLVQALPHLKPYHAIVTGKAVKSNMPMIVDLTDAPKS